MRRLAALYDIPANLAALDAVLAQVERENFEAVVIGGDVLPGPQPAACLARLRALPLPAHYLMGNGDRETLPAAALTMLRDNALQLSPGAKAWIAAWPATLRLPIAAIGDVLFCHATPANDTTIVPRDAPPKSASRRSAADAPLVVCGHTHIQFDRTVEGFPVVNAGSVGMPFEAPGAYWLELGPAVRLRRTEVA